jgi:hypothetical protein
VIHHPEHVFGNVDHHIGFAEVARQPPPSLHVGDDDIGIVIAPRPIERIHQRVGQHAARLQATLLLVLLHRFDSALS